MGALPPMSLNLLGATAAAGTTGAIGNRAARKATGFVSTHFEKRRAKLAAKVGLTPEQLPNRPIRKFFGKAAKATTEVVATGVSALAGFLAAGGRAAI